MRRGRILSDEELDALLTEEHRMVVPAFGQQTPEGRANVAAQMGLVRDDRGTIWEPRRRAVRTAAHVLLARLIGAVAAALTLAVLLAWHLRG